MQGRQILHYTFRVKLGQGGMGEVWAGVHCVTGRPVAIKRLSLPPGAQPCNEAVKRLELEARSSCATRHPNVVEVLDYFDEDELGPVIVLQQLQGETAR